MKYLDNLTDCTLEVEWISLVKCEQPDRPRKATPDVLLPSHTFPFMLGRRWGDDSVCSTQPADMKPAEKLSPVAIGERARAADGQSHLVQAYASVMLDRESNAREFHKVFFSKDQWDLIAGTVRTNEKIILEGCSICFDPKDEEVVVDTIEHYDFAQGEGFSTGTFKRYIPGVVDQVRSVAIAHELKMSGDQPSPEVPDGLFLPTYGELYEDAYPSYDPEPEDDYDDYEPKLSDFYDDLEELELNTRGDGFD